ncbi:MAG: hypothetical protein WCD42_00400 [Rhizomicrobium sp.]
MRKLATKTLAITLPVSLPPLARGPVLALALALPLSLALGGCSSSGPAPTESHGMSYDDEAAEAASSQSTALDKFSPVQTLLRFDANHDGKITRAELENGLKAEYAAADTNHDGVLELEEYRAVNDQRWKQFGAAATPLADWNGDGVVDFSEFSGGPRTLFEQIDANADGILTPQELNPRLKAAKKGAKGKGDAGPAPGGNGPQGGPQGGGGPGGEG